MTEEIVLVTGAGGFIGTHLVRRLAATSGHVPRGMYRRPPAADSPGNGKGQVAIADLRNPASVRAALTGCGAVVHLAHGDDATAPAETAALVEAALAARIRRFVHISSISVHGPTPGPECATEASATIMGPYGDSYCDSKAECERIVATAVARQSLPAIVLRPTIVYGPGSPFVDRVLREAESGSVSVVDRGTGVCNAVHLDDVCDAIVAALDAPPSVNGDAFFINADRAVSWREFNLALAGLVRPEAALVDIDSSACIRQRDAIERRYGELYGRRSSDGLSASGRSLLARIGNRLRLLSSRKARLQAGLEREARAARNAAARALRETVSVEFSNRRAREILQWAPRLDLAAGAEVIRDTMQNRD
jgi:nucleoside-diphosphate-sugar epimerase